MNAAVSVWVKGIVAAAINGFSTALAVVIVDPNHLTPAGLRRAGFIALVSSVLGVAGYLKQSPLPGTANQ